MFTTKRKGIIAILCAVFAAALIACAISLAPSATRTAPVYAAEGDVAAIGDTNYTSLKKAIDAAGDTATTITLLTNTAENITIASGQDITLALNGKDITVESGDVITNNGTLKITGIALSDVSTGDGYAVSNAGTLVIEGGAYRNDIYSANENVEISGGVNCRLYSIVPADFLADGYTLSYYTAGYFCPYAAASVAQIIRNGVEYDFKNITSANAGAVDGDTIQLLDDITTTGSIDKDNAITLSKSVMLDLCGFDITFTATNYSNNLIGVTGEKVVITNSSENESKLINKYGEGGNAYSVIHSEGANLTIENVTIESNANGVVFFGSLTPAAASEADPVTFNTLNMEGVKVSAYAFALSGNGSSAEDEAWSGTTINVTNSSLNSDQGCAIYQPQYGILNINGEETFIEGSSGIEVRAGILNVYAGTIRADWSEFTVYENAGGGSSVDGAAIVVSQHSTNLPISVNLNGGTYSSNSAGGMSVYEADLLNDVATDKIEIAIDGGEYTQPVESENVKGFVENGTFSEAFDSSYIAEGSVLYTTDGENYSVATGSEAIEAGVVIMVDGVGYTEVPESVVATVGAEGEVPAGYESLQDAIDAAADGDTITLVRDITTTSYTVIDDKDITIDLADFTITATGCDETYSSLLFIQGGSNVTIENGSLVGDFETSGINFDVIYLNSSNLTLNDVNISAAHDYMDGILFYGGMTNSDAVTAYNNKDFSNYYTLNVNNSTVVGYWYAIDGNAAGTHNGTIININNSTVTDATDVIGEPSGTAIFHPHFGILNVSGDDTLISGATGIEMRAGELNISGGNIVGNNEFMTSASGNGNSVFGAAVAVSQHTTNLLISVNVTGGTLETVGNAVYALYENDLMNDGDVDDITISVTGGTFNGEVYSEDVVDFISGGQFVVKPDDTYLAEGFSGFSEYNGMFVPVTSSTEGTMLEEIEQIRQEIADAIAEVNGALAGGDATTLAESMTKLIDRMNELEAMIGELDESMVTDADLQALRNSITVAYNAAVSRVRAELSAQISDLRDSMAEMGDVSGQLDELKAAYEAADALLSAEIDDLRAELTEADAELVAELDAAISELESTYKAADDAIWNAIYALRDADSGMTTALWVIGVIAVLALCAGVAGVAFAIVRTKRS